MANQPRLYASPLTLKEANAFVKEMHRHNKPVIGAKFCVGVIDETGTLRGVAIAGRPVSRVLDDGLTLEITRVATDGCPNACSFLYGVCRRIGFLLGYHRIITYTLQAESGISLKAAGWHMMSYVPPRESSGWNNRDGRERQLVVTLAKWRWEVTNPIVSPSPSSSCEKDSSNERPTQYLFG